MHSTTVKLIMVLFMALTLSGCVMFSSPVGQGLIITAVRGPVATGPSPSWDKVGRSSCINVLGFVAAGDASIDKAMKNGKITKIHHVDKRVVSAFIIFCRYYTIVYGE